MEESIKLEIVTPEKLLLEEVVDEVVAPGSEGEFGVLPGHTEFMTTLGIGEITYKQQGVSKHLAVSWGYAEVANNKVVILAETVEAAESIDLSRAEAKKIETEKLLKTNLEQKDFDRAQASLEKALIRIQVAGKASGSN